MTAAALVSQVLGEGELSKALTTLWLSLHQHHDCIQVYKTLNVWLLLLLSAAGAG
jgi:hypothetical protein